MTPPDDTLNDFSIRIKKAREFAGLSQKELADRVSVTQTAINKIEKGKSKSSRRTIRIAEVTGVSVIWLETGMGDMLDTHAESILNLKSTGYSNYGFTHRKNEESNSYPVYEDAEVWKREGKEGALKLISKETVDLYKECKVSVKSFFFKINDDSMEPRFACHDLVGIDPQRKPENQSHILVGSRSNQTLFVRQLVFDLKSRLLKPINPHYPILPMDDDIVVFGVVFNKIKHY